MGLVLKQCLRPALFAVALLSSAALLRASSGSKAPPDLKPYQYSLDRMGTIFRIALYAPDSAHALGAAMAAFERIEELEQILSDYREDSEVSRLCHNAGSAPAAVSPDLFSVLEQSLRVSRMTGGAFDVTIGPVVRLWREARKSGRLPDAAELKKAHAAVGYENVVLDRSARTVELTLPNMQLDFGGIGKGYAADQALAVLNSRGIHRAMVDGGGDLRLGAPPPGKGGWKIGVRNPGQAEHATPEYLLLHDVGVATSGDAFQFVEVAGRRYSHIVNPANGMGLSDSAMATVIARDGTTADALATAVSVMKPAEAIRVIESIEGSSAAIVSRTETGLKRITSSGFPKLQREK